MKGQQSIEFLVLFAGSLVFLLVMASVSIAGLGLVSGEMKTRDSLISTRELASSARSVCTVGGKETLNLWFPAGTRIHWQGKDLVSKVGNTTRTYYTGCPGMFAGYLEGPVRAVIQKRGSAVVISIQR